MTTHHLSLCVYFHAKVYIHTSYIQLHIKRLCIYKNAVQGANMVICGGAKVACINLTDLQMCLLSSFNIVLYRFPLKFIPGFTLKYSASYLAFVLFRIFHYITRFIWRKNRGTQCWLSFQIIDLFQIRV